MENYFFEETQKFRQIWLWIILSIAVLSNVVVAYFAISEIWSKNLSSMTILSLFLSVSIPLSILLLFYFTKLETRIDKTGIYYRLFPFNIRLKNIKPENIKNYEIKRYSPLGDYGGWGIRYGGRKGKAYNISGNIGIFFELDNRRKLLIGTQLPEELASAMKILLNK